MKKKKSSIPNKAVFGTMITSLALGSYIWFSTGKTNPIKVPSYTVARVIDGDTFETAEKQLIRLSSANAPELDHCWGKEAKEALEKLILGKPIYLKVQFRDPFYRLISVVYTDDGFINEIMVRNGHAHYGKTGKDTGEEMVAAADDARKHRRGIYSPKCTQKINRNSSCQIKGNINNGKIYYTPDCGMYNQVEVQLFQDDKWFCTEKEAQKAGFRKPSQCP